MSSIIGLIGILSTVAFLFGVANVIYPIKKLRIHSRRHAGVVCGVSTILLVIAVAATPSETDATVGAADSGLGGAATVTHLKNDASERQQQSETEIDVSVFYGRWASTERPSSCTESVTEYTAQQVTHYTFNEGMRENNMEPEIWRFEAEYFVRGEVIFVKSIGKGGDGVDAYRQSRDHMIERLAVIKPDGSVFGYTEMTVPPLDSLRTGDPLGSALVRCGSEADRFIASLDGVQNAIERTQQSVRSRIGHDDDVTLAYNLAWMSEVDQKCDLLDKEFLGDKYNSQLFSVTAGTNKNLRERMNMDEYNAAITIGIADAKVDSCNSPILKTKFWALWEVVKSVG